MSQLTLTPEEDQLVADALRAKATAYTAMYGVTDPALEALLDKVTGQLPQPEPVVVAAPVVEAVVQADPPDVVAAEEAVEAHFAAVEAAETTDEQE